MFKIDVVQIFDLVQLNNFSVLPFIQWGDVSAEMVDTIMLSVNSKKQLHHRPDEDEDAFKTGQMTMVRCLKLNRSLCALTKVRNGLLASEIQLRRKFCLESYG